MTIRTLLPVMAVALAATAAGQPTRVLTLDEALDRMMRNNPEIRASEHEVRAAGLERKAALGLYFPQIDVGGAYTYMGDDIGVDLNHLKQPVGELLGGLSGSLPPALVEQAQMLMRPSWALTIQDREMALVGGTVSMPLFMGGRIAAANRAAKINEAAAREKGTQTRNMLVSSLAEYYFGLALARQVVEVRKQVVGGMESHLADAIALERNGMIAAGERLYAEVKTAEAKRDLIHAQSLVRTLSSALSGLLDDEAGYVPVSPMFMLDELEPADYFKSMARNENPLLRQVTLKKELAQTGVRLQTAEFMPQIALTGATMFADYQYSEYLPRWTVGVGFKMKIFDGLHREHKFGAARHTVKQVEALETKAGNDVGVLVGKLYDELLNYRDQMPPIEASLAFAKEYLRVKDAAFKEGMGSSADLVDAQLNLAKIRTERMQTAYYYVLMLARLLEVSGASDQLADYARRPGVKTVLFE